MIESASGVITVRPFQSDLSLLTGEISFEARKFAEAIERNRRKTKRIAAIQQMKKFAKFRGMLN